MTKQKNSDKMFYLWTLLRRSSNAMLKARGLELQEYKSSPIQAAVLRAIIEHKGKGITAGEIAEYLFRENQTVSGLLNRMETNNLVKRYIDEDDHRIRRVIPTKKGRELYKKISHSETVVEILSALTKEERDEFERILQLIRSKSLEVIGRS